MLGIKRQESFSLYKKGTVFIRKAILFFEARSQSIIGDAKLTTIRGIALNIPSVGVHPARYRYGQVRYNASLEKQVVELRTKGVC